MRTCRGLFLLALSTSMFGHGQALPSTQMLVAGEFHARKPELFPKRMLSLEQPLPDAPVPIPDGEDFSSSSGQSRIQWPGVWDHSPAWRPLNGRERLALFWSDTYNSPGAFLALSMSALAGELENKPAQWSTDGNGYTRQFASAYGQMAARNVVHEGLAAVTGQEPRYIPCGCKGTLRRTRYALKMTFVTYSRAGRLTVDVPQMAGAYASGMISTYWYPHRYYNPLVQGVQFGHEQVGQVFAENLFKEFSPTLKAAFHRH